MHHPAPRRQRAAAALTALTTGTLILVLLAGMPYVLWHTTGSPQPEHVASWNDLTERLAQPVTDPLILDLLAMAAWLCWAAFAHTVIRETWWYAAHLSQLFRDRAVHHQHLADLPLKRSLAALCVGTLTLALLSLWQPQPSTAHVPDGVGELRAHTAASAPQHPSAALPATGEPTCAEKEAAAELGCVEYTVVEGDTLWDIARTRLGDPILWPRLYALNKDRPQPYGQRLEEPDDIRPGWQLTLPAAHTSQPEPPPRNGPDQHPSALDGEVNAAPTPPTVPAPEHGPTTRPSHGRNGPDGASSSRAHPEAAPGAAPISLGEASVIGITAAAGLLAALRCWRIHQRRRTSRDTTTAPTPLSCTVERAVDAACEAASATTPTDSDSLVTRRTPPAAPKPKPVITIGTTDDGEAQLELLAHPTGCAWTGPGADAALRALLVGVLTAAERQRPALAHTRALVHRELAEHLLPGLPAEFSALAQAPDTAHAVRRAEEHLLAHARHAASANDDADAEDPAEPNPGTLLLITPLDPAWTGELETLAARSTPGTLVVLTVGAALPGASSWHIASDGTTAVPGTERSQPLQLFRLTVDAAGDLLDMLLGAHGRHPKPPTTRTSEAFERQPEEQATDSPGDIRELEPPELELPAIPAPSPSASPGQSKPVRLHVLGPLLVHVKNNPEPIGSHLRTETRELLTLLVAHPNGLLATDIARNLHLDEDPDQIARDMKNLRRAIRRTLRSATGFTSAEFILRHGEIHKLNPELMETDLAEFHSVMKKAAQADTAAAEFTAVRQALELYRGPFAAECDHLWADGLREHLATQFCDAVVRLAHRAEHTQAQDEQDAALAVLEYALGHHPDNERLCTAAIRLHQAAGRDEAAHRTYVRLKRHLAQLDLEPDPAVRALLSRKTGVR